MSNVIGKTVPGSGMDKIFKEVQHQESLGLNSYETKGKMKKSKHVYKKDLQERRIWIIKMPGWT